MSLRGAQRTYDRPDIRKVFFSEIAEAAELIQLRTAAMLAAGEPTLAELDRIAAVLGVTRLDLHRPPTLATIYAPRELGKAESGMVLTGSHREKYPPSRLSRGDRPCAIRP